MESQSQGDLTSTTSCFLILCEQTLTGEVLLCFFFSLNLHFHFTSPQYKYGSIFKFNFLKYHVIF